MAMVVSNSTPTGATQFAVAGAIAVVGLPLYFMQWLEEIIAMSQDLILVRSVAQLKRRLKGKSLSAVITAPGTRGLARVKEEFPAANLFMLFDPEADDADQKDIAAMAAAYRLGAALVKARDAFLKLAGPLGLQKMRPLGPGMILDHAYELLELVGEGGFGTCFRARNINDQAHYIVKVIYKEDDDDLRFTTEHEAVIKYQTIAPVCKNLLQVLHVGSDRFGRFFYYSLPCADSAEQAGPSAANAGQGRYTPLTLAAHIQAHKNRPFDTRDVLQIALSLLNGLTYLHLHGLLHNDLKPANAIYLRDQWVIADPGLVNFIGHVPPAKTKYFAPADGPQGRPSDDLYALGKCIWVMTSGLAAAQLDDYQLGIMRPEAGDEPSIEAVIARACAKDPAERFQTADEMKVAIEAVLGSSSGENNS
jgi:serine/threonine protein kinase